MVNQRTYSVATSCRPQALKETATVVQLDHACSAFSGDVIGQILWDDQEKFLDDPNFAPEWYGPKL